jgi:SAM-dependent methyltransferase
MSASTQQGVCCPLCGSDRLIARTDIDPIIRSVYVHSHAATCGACGVSFMAPVPGPSDIENEYGEEYFRAYSEHGIPMPAEAARPPARYLRRLAAVQRRSGTGSLLEIGPGTGAFLNYAKDAGWRVLGLEASRYAAEKAAARYGLDIRCGTLQSVNLNSEQFDMVHMSHVLEHLADPVTSLAIIFRLLKPGGSLVIEVPHEFDNLQFKILKAAGLQRPYDVKCTHIFFFTPPTLKQLLERTGFGRAEVATVRDLEGGSMLRQILRRVAASIEQPLAGAPLIEAIAVK